MIKIPDQIWYVLGVGRADDLSYMCPYDTKADGDPLASTVKMLETGRSWAKNWRSKEGPAIEKIEPNVPTTGIYIGSSVERYSTSNKLFRVKDPRGFTVEVPTDNIATLLHNSTVVNGVIQEPCVWARDGGHILLPVNSTPYREANKAIDALKNDLIPVSKLQPGDVVVFFGDDKLRIAPPVRTFLGRAKLTYQLTWIYQEPRQYYQQNEKPPVRHETYVVKDDKWVPYFDVSYGGSTAKLEDTLSPKIVARAQGGAKRVPGLSEYKDSWYGCPDRVLKQMGHWGERKVGYYTGWKVEIKVLDAEWKA